MPQEAVQGKSHVALNAEGTNHTGHNKCIYMLYNYTTASVDGPCPSTNKLPYPLCRH
jgi:hypothetical protein